MFLKQLKLSIDRLLSDFSFQIEVLNDLISCGFIHVNLHYHQTEDKFSNMMLQMALCKATSISSLSEGMNLWDQNDPKSTYIDIQSISSIFRSLFENYGFFNHLYIQDWTKEEFLVLCNIWKISSLNQRFSLVEKNSSPMNEENQNKINEEKEFVSKLTTEIKRTQIYGKNKKSIDSYLDQNKWQITFIKGKIRPISWKNIHANTNKIHSKDPRSYQILSLDAHPSYYSVFQFGDMYKNRHDLERRGTILYQTIQLLCCYIFDFRKLTTDIEAAGINKETLHLINFLGKDQKRII